MFSPITHVLAHPCPVNLGPSADLATTYSQAPALPSKAAVRAGKRRCRQTSRMTSTGATGLKTAVSECREHSNPGGVEGLEGFEGFEAFERV